MAEQNGTASANEHTAQGSVASNPAVGDKGKGKAVDHQQQHHEDVSMDDDDESEEESNAEEEAGEPEGEDEDNMEEIDTDNIVGRRTRGKNIDFAEAAKNAELDEDDEEDDEDFEDPDEEMHG